MTTRNIPFAHRALSGPLLALGLALAASAPAGWAQLPDAGSGQDNAPAFTPGASRMVRGTLTAVAPDKLTLKTEAGEIYTVVLTPNTQIRHDREPLKLADVHVGDGAGAIGELDRANRTVHALYVGVVGADEIKKARDAMGKTWIAGTVTAINDLKLTVLRPDKVTQIIQVDEDTSFKRGGRNMGAMLAGSGELGGGYGGTGQGGNGNPTATAESITLPDVKVGDSVAGPGALKGGLFTPTQLVVGEPTARRRRGSGEAGATAPTPPTERK